VAAAAVRACTPNGAHDNNINTARNIMWVHDEKRVDPTRRASGERIINKPRAGDVCERQINNNSTLSRRQTLRRRRRWQ